MKVAESFPISLGNSEAVKVACTSVISTWSAKNINARTAGPAAWQILGKVAKFAPIKDFLLADLLTEVVLLVSNFLDLHEGQLSVGLFDLDKMFSNVLVKLVDIWSRYSSLNVERNPKMLMDFIRLILKRLKGHARPDLEKDIRRLSIQADDHIQFDIETPQKDPTLLQLIVIAQESLLKIQLLGKVHVKDKLLQVLGKNLNELIQHDSIHVRKNLVSYMVGLLHGSLNTVDLGCWFRVWNFLGSICVEILTEDEFLSITTALKTFSINISSEIDVIPESWASQIICIRANRLDSVSEASNLLVIAELVAKVAKDPLCISPKVLKVLTDFHPPSKSHFVKYFLHAVEVLRSSLPSILGSGDTAVQLLSCVHMIISKCDLPEKILVVWSYSLLHFTVNVTTPNALKLNQLLCHMLLALPAVPEQQYKIKRLVTRFYSSIGDFDKFLMIKTGGDESRSLFQLFLENCSFAHIDFNYLTTCVLEFIKDIPEPWDLLMPWTKLLCFNPTATFMLQSQSELYRLLRACDKFITSRDKYSVIRAHLKQTFPLEGFDLVDALVQTKSRHRDAFMIWEHPSIEAQMFAFITNDSELSASNGALTIRGCFEYELLELYVNKMAAKGAINISLMINECSGGFWNRKAQDLLTKVDFLFSGKLPKSADSPYSGRLLGHAPCIEHTNGIEASYASYYMVK